MTKSSSSSRLLGLVHGVVLGGFAGAVAGAVEYARLSDAFSGDVAAAYLKVAIPYAILGGLVGLLAAVLSILTTRTALTPGRALARVAALVTGLGAAGLIGSWAALQLGTPVLRPTVLAAGLGAAVAGALAGVLTDRVLRSALTGLERRLAGSRAGVSVVAPVALALLTAAFLLVPPVVLGRAHAVTPGPAAAHGADRPNIVFILIDALRPDHLPFYGYSRPTAPALTALAGTGQVFTGAYAQASYTRASVATILTSLYPSVHKANDDRDFLSGSVTVLPELLRAAGYQTFAISSNANVSPTFGYSRGFDEFRVWKTESEFRLTLTGRMLERVLGPTRLTRLLLEPTEIVPTADHITDSTLEWLGRKPRSPFFLYVHYIDPHDPYRPPAPHDQAFDHRKDPPRRGTIDPLALVRGKADRAQVGRTLDLYDGEIQYADLHVGRLLQSLKAQGLLDNTLVVITADHGEEFFEHGDEIHGRSAYEEVLRVPLVVAWPGRIRPGQSDALVGHIDLMPTLLDVAGAKPPPGIQGRSLLPLLQDPAAAWPPRPLLAQVIQRSFAIEAIRDGNFKYVRHTRGPRAGAEELYDLTQDPLERTDVAGEARARLASLRKTLDVFNDVLAHHARQVPTEQVNKLDRDTERALRSLGYIK